MLVNGQTGTTRGGHNRLESPFLAIQLQAILCELCCQRNDFRVMLVSVLAGSDGNLMKSNLWLIYGCASVYSTMTGDVQCVYLVVYSVQ